MCGPIACFVSNQGHAKLYHLGRLITYVLLGSLAGAFGDLMLNQISRSFYLVVIFGVTGLIIFSGIVRLNIVSIKNAKVNYLKNKTNLLFIRLFKKWANRSSLILGLLTGFLPCSWLYMFVLSAITTHSAFSGAVVLFIFWSGGLPALIAVTSGMTKLVKKSPIYHQKVAGIVLIFAALFSAFSFAMNIKF